MPSTNNNNTKSNSNDAVAQQQKESSSSPSKRSISADAVKAPEFVPQQQRPQQNQQQRQGRNFQQRDDPGRQAHVEFTRNLVEFYFSPENLAFDTYLASCLSSKRLMPIQALVQFPRMLENRVTPALIIEACQLTNKVTLELSRETHAYWIGPSVPGCHPNQATLILREIPVQVGKEEVFERLNAVLAPLGSFLESIAPASKHNGTWFLNFVNGASARIALKSLAGTPNMWKPTANTVIRFKEAAHTGHVRSSFAPVPFQTGAAPVNGGGAPGPNPQFQQVVHAFQQATQGEEHILEYQQQNRNRSRSHSRRRHVPTAMSRGGRGGKFSGRGGGAGGNARAPSRGNNNNNINASTKQQQTRTASGNSRTSERSSNSSNGRRSPLAEAFLTPFPSPENKGKSKNITNTAASPPSQATRNVTSPDIENNKNKKFEGITSPPKKLPLKTEEMPALASEENTTNNSNNNSPSLNYGKLFNNTKTDEKENNNNNNNKAKTTSTTPAPEKKNTAATKTVTVKETEEEKNDNNNKNQQNRSSSRQNNNRNNSRSGSTSSRAAVPASGYKPLGGPHMSLMFGEGTHSYHRDFQQYFKAVADFGILPPSVEARLKQQSTPEGQASLPVSDAAHAAGISNQQNPRQSQEQQQNGGTPVRPLTQAEQQLMWQLMMQYQQSMGYSADPYSYSNDNSSGEQEQQQQQQTNGAAARSSSSSQNIKKEKQQFPTHASSSKNNNNNHTNGSSNKHHQDPNGASLNNGEQQQKTSTEKNDDTNNNKQKRVMNTNKTVATNGHKK